MDMVFLFFWKCFWYDGLGIFEYREMEVLGGFFEDWGGKGCGGLGVV